MSAVAFALAVLTVVSPGLFDGARLHTSDATVGAGAAPAHQGSSFPPSEPRKPALAGRLGDRSRGCRPVARPGGYVDPLVEANVTPERIDQGVDYAGTGTLIAVGDARITRVDTAAAGWPGAFIEYRLLGGSDRGCYVYYAEGVSPIPGLRPGRSVVAGQALATLIPHWSTGIEIGWGAGVGDKTYATSMGQWSIAADADNIPTAAGKSFSALIGVLGGPQGKVEG